MLPTCVEIAVEIQSHSVPQSGRNAAPRASHYFAPSIISVMHHSSRDLKWLCGSLACALVVADLGFSQVAQSVKPAGLEIGSRRELFVDDYLIDTLKGQAQLRLHHPEPREIVLKLDAPWEGSGSSGYHSVFRDGELYRMYYKGWHIGFDQARKKIKPAISTMCYAESTDGIHWRKPSLGLIDYQGSKENNIVAIDGLVSGMKMVAGVMAMTKDGNPAALPQARYKAFGLSTKPKGIVPFQSADGMNWTPMAAQPVITNGAFDNQNVLFWNPSEAKYRAYWRIFAGGDNNTATANPIGVRAIRTATSADLIHWEDERDVTYVDSPQEALYTTPIKPYDRAPHLLIGFPARYVERDSAQVLGELPEPEHRALRESVNKRYGTAITESLFMASRDGVRFKRWNEAFLRPGIERPGTWNYGHQFLSWHPVETRSTLEGAPNELSFYAPESYWTGTSSEVRRYTLRLDGFVSVQAPLVGGELITKPLRFVGKELSLNFSTSAAGEVRVEIQDAAGQPLAGYSLEDCPPIFGDTLSRTVLWNSGSDVHALAGTPIRLRFSLKDADVFSFKFNE